MRSLFLLLGVVSTAGCAALLGQPLDDRYGAPSVPDRLVAATAAVPEFHRDVKPIFDARCVVCHACYDAPCQLKLTSFEGVDRGASKDLVYDGSRLLAAEPSRLFVDARSTAEWRAKGFFPVLNERRQTPDANRTAGTLMRMLGLKRDHPLPATRILPDGFDFGLDRAQQCTDIESFDGFAKRYPLWGMPFGLPALEEDAYETVARWIEAGAPAAPIAPPSPAHLERVGRWESFFNGTTPKARLAARYMYEHLFLAHLYFADLGPGTVFRLVRSSTPPGEPVVELATRRPFDPPGVPRFYYRLRREEGTTVAKTHMPYALSDARMARWTELFLDADYVVASLPGYAPSVASNPFEAFAQIPIDARYRFMLEEAQFTLMGFIKGPVCRGQVALDVINDHFWVFFVSPEAEALHGLSAEIQRESADLRLPAEASSNALPVTTWLKYSRSYARYLEHRAAWLKKTFPDGERMTLDLFWDGDGHDRDAALTVFRHFDSATVLKGMLGGEPKTAWLIGYSLLERIHYLLVAGFDVYGNVGHQLNTRLYMDFLRMEGEDGFLAFLPEADAVRELHSWYRDAEDAVAEYADILHAIGNEAPALDFRTDDPKRELYAMLRARLGPVVVPPDPIGGEGEGADATPRIVALRRLARLEGEALVNLPEQSILRITDARGVGDVYTLLVDRAHTNVASVFREQKRLVPAEYRLSVLPGIVGSYPNAFFRLRDEEIDAFTNAVAGLRDEADYAALLDGYGVRRTNGDFWAYSDWLHAWYRESQPIEAGRLDYNRFENR